MWLEKDQQTKQIRNKTSAELDNERATSLPVVSKEVEAGAPAFQPMKFNPVVGTNVFEGEFATKGNDIILHFWPYGYHAADAAGRPTPAFHRDFRETLKSTFEKEFGKGRVVIKDDRDMGALFVQILGWASNQFHRDVTVKALKTFFTNMGGVEG